MIMKLSNLFWICIFTVLTACQTNSLRVEHQQPDGQTSDATHSESIPLAPVEAPTKEPAPHDEVRLGIILGPGGAKAYSEIGFLKELQARKIPVQAIVGLEWGALVASSFAAKGSAHEVEWQLSKLKESGSSWLGKSQGSIRDALSPIKPFLRSLSVNEFKIPFACPSLNLKKQHVYLMQRGRLDQLLPYCLPYPPVFSPYQRTIAGVREIQESVEFLRKAGANYIVLVNVLADSNQKEPVNWLELSYDMKRRWPGVNERLDILIPNKSINDFDSRQDLIQLGSDQSAPFAEKLMNRFF